eukprot:12176944-Alexandrium_andersonii.AAC.1
MCIRDRTSAEAPHRLAHELLGHQFLRDIQVCVVPGEGEVVKVHEAPRDQRGFVEAARAGLAPGDPEALEGLHAQRLPASRSSSSA